MVSCAAPFSTSFARSHSHPPVTCGSSDRSFSPHTSPQFRQAGFGRGSWISFSTTGTDTPEENRCETWSTSRLDTDSMEKIIKAAVDRGASDLHIKAGDVFRARVHGELVALTKQALSAEQTKAIALHLMSNEDDKKRIDTILDYDCSWAAAGIGRFRVNIMKQRGSFSIIMRVIPWDVPTFDKLGLPPVLADIAGTERGMVLVTGVTG